MPDEPHRYDRLPAAGKRLARVPRYARLLAHLPESDFVELRNEASTYWKVYFRIDAIHRDRTGLLDDGLKPAEARRLGWHHTTPPNFDAPETREWQVRLAGDLIGAIAFEMFFGAREGEAESTEPRTAITNTQELTRLLTRVARRLKATEPQVKAEDDLEPAPCAYSKQSGDAIAVDYFVPIDWPRLKAMNMHGLGYLLFNDNHAGLRFTDISTQAFFAALWTARWGSEADRALLAGKIPRHGDDARRDPNQVYLEFWRMLAELPQAAWHEAAQQERWVQTVAPLFRPGDGTAAGTERNCELIWRFWEPLWAVARPAREAEEQARAEEHARHEKAAREAKQTVPPLLGVEGLRRLAPPASGGETPADLAWGTLVEFQAEFSEQCLSGRRGAEVQRIAKDFVGGFQRIPAGEFEMGSPKTEKGRSEDELQHRVKLTRDFLLHQHQTTNELFRLFLPGHDSGNTWSDKSLNGARQPVVEVDWWMSLVFARWASFGGRSCRLPTESEWEYACRAGTTTPFHFGPACNGSQANCNGILPYGTSEQGPYLECTSEVGSYARNGFKLFDMHGNVWEWCADWYGPYPAELTEDPMGPASGSNRVYRGGGWSGTARYCRSALRFRYAPSSRYYYLGFRLALSPSGNE